MVRKLIESLSRLPAIGVTRRVEACLFAVDA